MNVGNNARCSALRLRGRYLILILAAHHDLECFVGQMSGARIQTSHVDGSPRICELVEYRLEEIALRGGPGPPPFP